MIGFAIVFIPPTRDFWLLEYMAVDATARSSGIGSKLFDAAVQFAAENTDGAPGILEVDAPTGRPPPDSPIRRRLSFYARKGCRVIDGLQYILPPLQGTAPPPMMLLVQGVPEQSAFERSAVQHWLAALYVDVYGQAADDARIGRMVAPLPDRVGLASISSLL